MRTVIVDDEPSARKGIKRILAHHPIIDIVDEAHSIKSLYAKLNQHKPDLILLDIMLRDSNSLDEIQKIHASSLIIITTAFDNHALKGFDINAVDYLLKPISEKRLYEAIDKALLIHSSKRKMGEFIFIKSNGRYIRLNRDEVLYIQGLQNYVLVHTAKQKHICKTTMKAILRELDATQFIQCHRSYIINSLKVDGLEKQSLYINKQELPIGKTMKKQVYLKLGIS